MVNIDAAAPWGKLLEARALHVCERRDEVAISSNFLVRNHTAGATVAASNRTSLRAVRAKRMEINATGPIDSFYTLAKQPGPRAT